MTAVFRYHTNVFVKKKYHLILSFTLSNDISLCSVLGLLSLLSMGATFNLTLDKLIC